MKDQTIYGFTATDMRGNEVSLEKYRGKVVLIVNTASRCGEAPQLEKLEALYQRYKDRGFEILGFPCGQFAGQEPLEGEAIAEFCKINYGVTFPMFQKVDVRGKNAHPLFNFLASKNANGKYGVRPWWNYYKYLIDAEGRTADYWITYTQPDVSRIAQAIEKELSKAPIPAK